jgi:hypothetical protein
VARWFGVRPETISGSLALRIGLPAAAFAIVFVWVYWYCGRPVDEPPISEEMSDAEIAKALKKRSW